MKAMIVRSVYAVVAAVAVAGGMLMTAKPAAAAPQGCYLITHFSQQGAGESRLIVVNANSWKGHAKHGDIWELDVPCEDVEDAPV